MSLVSRINTTPGKCCFVYCGDNRCTCEKHPLARRSLKIGRIIPPDYGEQEAETIFDDDGDEPE